MSEIIEAEATDVRPRGRGRAVAKPQSSAVAERVETLPAPMSDLDKILAIANNPEVPMERVSAMIDLYERLEASRARKAFNQAFALMISELPVIERNGTIKTNEKDRAGNKTGNQIEQSKYALFEDILEGIKPVLAKFGFSISHRFTQTPDRLETTGILAHCEGHSEQTSISLPIDTSGSKNNTQGWGSTSSYGKRYTTCALLPIVTKGEDDDGNKADAGDGLRSVTDDQAAELDALCKASGTSVANFLRIAKAENLRDVLAKDFEGLKLVLKAKTPAKGGAQ